MPDTKSVKFVLKALIDYDLYWRGFRCVLVLLSNCGELVLQLQRDCRTFPSVSLVNL
jgi:hypothetical protein